MHQDENTGLWLDEHQQIEKISPPEKPDQPDSWWWEG
jgi:hypothetical protein